MAIFCTQLDNEFEYISHELNAHRFWDCVRWYMKFEQSQMKKIYLKSVGQFVCFMGVHVNQWEKLVVYWEECNTKKKSE